MVVELDTGAEGAVAERCDLPAAGVWDFGEEAADVQALQAAAEGGLGAPALCGIAVVAVKYPAEVGVAKAAE